MKLERFQPPLLSRYWPKLNPQGEYVKYSDCMALNAELLEALLLAREYVAKTHSVVAGAAGYNNLILPDLEKVDAAIAKAKS